MLKLFLLSLSITNFQFFWVIKISHIFIFGLFFKYKAWKLKLPYAFIFLWIAIILALFSSLKNVGQNIFIDITGIVLCIFTYVTSMGIAKYNNNDFLVKLIYNSVFYISTIVLILYFIEHFLNFDLRDYIFLNRENSASYFGLKRNYGLASEPGNFSYFYIAITGFVAWYFYKNQNIKTSIKAMLIVGSLILTFSAGAIGIALMSLSLTLFFYSFSNFYRATGILISIIVVIFISTQLITYEYLEPIFNKLTLSSSHKSSFTRLEAWEFGLSKISILEPFGFGPNYIDDIFDHSLFNWFLTFSVSYGIFAGFFLVVFFIFEVVNILKWDSEFKYFLLFSMVCIFGILNIVGVYHSVVYWFVLGLTKGLTYKNA